MRKSLQSPAKKRSTEQNAAQAALRQANDRSELISLVAHELRTPMSAIKESIQLVLDGIDGPITADQEMTLGIAKRNVDRLARLINDVLDFSKLEFGKMELRLARCNVNDLVREVCQLMDLTAQKKPLTLSIEMPATPIYARCDPDKIKQILLNLIDNAIKYTDENGHITVRLSLVETVIVLEVEDTGIGITAEDQNRLFEMFAQLSQPGARKSRGGSGLGLVLCKRLVELHEGTITIRSATGKGSCFTVRLPFSG